MQHILRFTSVAKLQYENLADNKTLEKRFKAVNKALGYLENNPRHPSLNTHKYSDFVGENGEDIFEAYAENNTPQAYRIFWHYGADKKQITVISITPHP